MLSSQRLTADSMDFLGLQAPTASIYMDFYGLQATSPPPGARLYGLLWPAGHLLTTAYYYLSMLSIAIASGSTFLFLSYTTN